MERCCMFRPVVKTSSRPSSWIRYNGIDYLLRQYVTASGYGYRNPLADIRGKGQQVTLSLAGNDTSIDFVEQK